MIFATAALPCYNEQSIKMVPRSLPKPLSNQHPNLHRFGSQLGSISRRFWEHPWKVWGAVWEFCFDIFEGRKHTVWDCRRVLNKLFWQTNATSHSGSSYWLKIRILMAWMWKAHYIGGHFLSNCVERNSHKPESLWAQTIFPYIILSHLLLSLEMTRRLCRRVISEALPAIFPYKKQPIQKPIRNV